MRLDARKLPNGTQLDFDLCIAGAGPAGLTLARQFARSQIRVCVIEAGGERATAKDLRDLELEPGGEIGPQSLSRWRGLGGTAAVWTSQGSRATVMRAPRLDPADFQVRNWVAHSGWPFSLEHLTAFYERAEAMLRLQPLTPIRQGFELDASTLRTQFDRFSPSSFFTHELPQELTASGNVTLLTNATVREIERGEDGRTVEAMRVGSALEHDIRVRGRQIVVAAGAIENARLMLNSQVGNENDLVGRFFFNRQVAKTGELLPLGPRFYERIGAYDISNAGEQLLGGKLVYTEEALRQHRMLNLNTQLWPEPDAKAVLDSLRALTRVRQAGYGGSAPSHVATILKRGPAILDLGLRLASIQRSLPPQIRRGGWSRLPKSGRRFASFGVVHQAEPTPSAESRIVLGAGRDSFGMQRARVEMTWGAQEQETIRRAHGLIAAEFERLGLARMVENPGGELQIMQQGGIHHHLGGTRMHADPRQGVVDADSRVHGLANLYVAGSSVFPTAGNANPTLTILALAMRLSDHLKKELD
jgi:choline dehydrogenase-like flavoprotein